MLQPKRFVDPNHSEALAEGDVVAKDARSVLTRIFLQHKLISEEDLSRCDRIAGKLGADTTFVQLLKKMNLVEETDVLDAVRHHGFCLPYGTLLVELGYITEIELRQMLMVQHEEEFRQKLGELLIDRQLVKESDANRVLACHMGLNFEEPDLPDCEQRLLHLAPLKTMTKLEFFPVRSDGFKTVVVFTDPLNQIARTEAARVYATEIDPVLTSKSTLKRLTVLLPQYREVNLRVAAKREDGAGAPAQVYWILQSAIKLGASDIHVEPLKDRVRIRNRIDGVLREHSELKKSDYASVVSRLKIEAGTDIGERRRHQDGRIRFVDRTTGQETDLRISFYVTIHGECVVMRILNRSDTLPKLDEMGVPPATLARFEQRALEAPSGVIIVTGPTGSGKTTTLYSCVNHLNDDSTSIITAEEPVEYTIDGISQCSLNNKIGRTFDESLRHIVRQDPDVIVLGEVRDQHSAECAIQAALTGHKVLTTFHTEDAVGGLLRLLNMNLEAFLIASTVTCVVAQRLIRKICKHCCEEIPTDKKTLNILGWTHKDVADLTFHSGKGCPKCQFSGFSGRMAVFEPLILNEAVRDAILTNVTASELRRISIEKAGLVTLLEDGLLKAAAGLTTLAEVRRTLPRVTNPRGITDLKRLSGMNI
ncbi:MAG: Flp pilus assembly complex ATPase component TadA [Granulosicoccus sp.]|nr:Flp pilus assembly complex ATPase component TadA [Granulosicoccus sp.]